MIGARLERDPHPTSKDADLVIRNYGQSVAYNVRVQFEPELKDTGTTSGEDSFMPLLLRRYETPISNLMPGVELRSLWFMPGQTRDGIVVNDEPIPDLVTATISYSDRPQVAGKDTNRYSESFQLDVEILRGDVLSTRTDDHLGLHKRSVKAIEAMKPDIKVMARSMSKMEDYAKPDSVREREGAQAEEHRRRAEARQRSRDEAMRERLGADDISSTSTPSPK